MVWGKITEADTPTIHMGATPSGLISDPSLNTPSHLFTPVALLATTLQLYPGLGQASNMLNCIASGVVSFSMLVDIIFQSADIDTSGKNWSVFEVTSAQRTCRVPVWFAHLCVVFNLFYVHVCLYCRNIMTRCRVPTPTASCLCRQWCLRSWRWWQHATPTRRRRARRRLRAAGQQLRTSRWKRSDWWPLWSRRRRDIVASCRVTRARASWRRWRAVWWTVLRCRHLNASRHRPCQPPYPTRPPSLCDVVARCRHCRRVTLSVWRSLWYVYDDVLRSLVDTQSRSVIVIKHDWRSRVGSLMQQRFLCLIAMMNGWDVALQVG